MKCLQVHKVLWIWSVCHSIHWGQWIVLADRWYDLVHRDHLNCGVQRLNWIMQFVYIKWIRKIAILPFKILRTVSIWPDALGLWCAVSKQDQRARIPTLRWSSRLDCCRCRRSLDRGLAIAGNSSMAASWSRWLRVRSRHAALFTNVRCSHYPQTILSLTLAPIYFCLSLSSLAVSCLILGILSDI